MRTLVEQTAEVVRCWFKRLAVEEEGTGHIPRPEDVHVLMGGETRRDWLESPERPAILIGTQDMLLSRALMRGYASSRAIWPMEFALLHEDAQWVFDEVQLMGAGRPTSAQLEAFRREDEIARLRNGRSTGIKARSLWISATLDPEWLATVDHPAPAKEEVLRVTPLVGGNSRLEQLANAPKRLCRSPVAPASVKQADLHDYVGKLAREILDSHRTGQMTLAIVNRVDRAQLLHGAIEKALVGKSEPALALIHSRFRSADRARQMRVVKGGMNNSPDRIVVATQAVEAGVDISAAILFTELAPWSSLVQRFGRANRYAEVPCGAEVRWIDLASAGTPDDSTAAALAIPYKAAELEDARNQLAKLCDVAPAHLSPPDTIDPPRVVIRRKDLDDLFDTDPDMTGFDVDISPYVRGAEDTDIRVFWRSLSDAGDDPPSPFPEELCAVSLRVARSWIRKLRGKGLLFRRDPQWRRGSPQTGKAPPGWTPLEDNLWPGLVVLADPKAGGYGTNLGFTGDPRHVSEPISDSVLAAGAEALDSENLTRYETDGHDEDLLSQMGAIVPLADHLQHVGADAESLCAALHIESGEKAAVVRAARWHDLGKAHEVFQKTMIRGLDGQQERPGVLLAKSVRRTRHCRPYFRHELASALAFLAQEGWSRDADLVAYLIAAHHGKVRLNLRALPREKAPKDHPAGTRFARGIWEGDELPAFDLEGGDRWGGGTLRLSVMELGWDEITRESWTERTRELLRRLGPFRLAWLETLVRVADWRASRKEREGEWRAG